MGKIIATIDPKTGKTEIKAEGYSGPVCKSKTAPFIKKLGGEVVDDKETLEMYNNEQNDQVQSQF